MSLAPLSLPGGALPWRAVAGLPPAVGSTNLQGGHVRCQSLRAEKKILCLFATASLFPRLAVYRLTRSQHLAPAHKVFDRQPAHD